jgi:2,4-dienoyl-CoA reductase-like NADH-dependent reductase (Old Yellow Enzyme family)
MKTSGGEFMPTLQDPIRIGDWELPNRVIMAPLTRTRSSAGRVPNDLMRQYYEQRAGAGLIISEATSVSPMGVGYPDTPGIWSEEQVTGWKAVTKGVHSAGGQILLQLWHVGRVSDPIYLNGALPVAPSPIAPGGHVRLIRPERPFVTPRALEVDEIPGIIAEHKRAAENAMTAGFDGVEIAGTNGYLLDQFLQDLSNHRTDEYGGSIENRARLMLAVVDAVVSVWGPKRVGLHLNPRGDLNSMGDSNKVETFGYVAREVSKRAIAFILAKESLEEPRVGPLIRKAFGGVYVANDSFSREAGDTMLANGEADAVAYGRLFIANPDLPRRFALNAPLNEPDPQTFYGRQFGPKGYTDYPFLDEVELAA